MNDIDRLYPQAEGQPGRLQLSGQRKPKALIALQRDEADAWAEVTRLAEVSENIISREIELEISAAVKTAVQKQKRASAAYADFYRDPDPWWAAEDAQETREAGSAGFQGGE